MRPIDLASTEQRVKRLAKLTDDESYVAMLENVAVLAAHQRDTGDAGPLHHALNLLTVQGARRESTA